MRLKRTKIKFFQDFLKSLTKSGGVGDAKGLDPTKISIDGILNQEKYNSEAGLMFVLKDTNSKNRVNLIDLLKDGAKYQMWHAVARWAAGILNDFPAYHEINDYEVMKDALHQISVINLKKTTGSASVHSSSVTAFAHLDKDLLLKQFRMINPKLIIAGGTFEQLIWLLDLDIDPLDVWQPAKSRILDAWVIPWRHPNRVSNLNSYEQLKELFKETNMSVDRQ